MKVIILGANGQFGHDLVQAFGTGPNEVLGVTHQDLEVADFPSVQDLLGHQRPDVVINTAAFHNVDACEAEPERAFAVNSLGVRNLALAARTRSFRIIHISTDYVFDG